MDAKRVDSRQLKCAHPTPEHHRNAPSPPACQVEKIDVRNRYTFLTGVHTQIVRRSACAVCRAHPPPAQRHTCEHYVYVSYRQVYT